MDGSDFVSPCSTPFWNPSLPAIQGHSGGTLVDPTLQDKCTVSRGLRRAHLPHRERDRHALYYQQWTESRWKASQKRERQCVFFTAVNPMDEHRFPENVRYDLDKARTVAEKNEWQVHQKCSVLVQIETCSQGRIAVLSKTDRTHCRAALGSFGSILNQNTHNRWVYFFSIPLQYLIRVGHLDEALRVFREFGSSHFCSNGVFPKVTFFVVSILRPS